MGEVRRPVFGGVSMNSDSSPRFRLSVWRPAQRGRQLDYATLENEPLNSAPVFNHRRLQEEIYQWHPGPEDVWGCITDSTLTDRLRSLFINGFAPSLPPEKRSMAAFGRAVDDFGQAITADSVMSWADTMQSVKVGRHEPANLRGNCTLSLWHQMEWIYRTFGHLPGASVTIR
jgi:hypothetical protein